MKDRCKTRSLGVTRLTLCITLWLAFLLLAACIRSPGLAPSLSASPVIPTPIHTHTPISTATSTSTLSIPTPTVNWIKTWTVRVYYSSTKSLDNYSLVDLLFRKWIEQYEDENVVERYKLEDYEIDDVIISKEYQQFSDQKGIDFIAQVIYSVKPTLINSATWWVAGNGKLDGDWVRHKGFYVGVTKKNDYYELTVLGHCLDC